MGVYALCIVLLYSPGADFHGRTRKRRNIRHGGTGTMGTKNEKENANSHALHGVATRRLERHPPSCTLRRGGTGVLVTKQSNKSLNHYPIITFDANAWSLRCTMYEYKGVTLVVRSTNTPMRYPHRPRRRRTAWPRSSRPRRLGATAVVGYGAVPTPMSSILWGVSRSTVKGWRLDSESTRPRRNSSWRKAAVGAYCGTM